MHTLAILAPVCHSPETVVSHVEGARFALVERVAEEVAELLLARFNSPWVRIKLSKPGAVARAANVGVIIERGNNYFLSDYCHAQ